MATAPFRLSGAAILTILAHAAIGCSAPSSNDATSTDDLQHADTLTVEGVGQLKGGGASCSGTLIAPDLVLTARHCLQLRDSETWFSVGQGGNAEYSQTTKWYALSDDETSGLLEVGLDAVVVELATPITRTKPLRYDPSWGTSAKEGSKVRAVGFGLGSKDGGEADLVVLATSGAAQKKRYSSLDDFEAAFSEPPDASKLQSYYDYELTSGSEVWAYDPSGTSQPCSGDSGGGALVKKGKEWVVAGVLSWVMRTPGGDCASLGVAVATLGTAKGTLDELGACAVNAKTCAF